MLSSWLYLLQNCSYGPLKFYIVGIENFTLFCCCDLDLDPMISIWKLDPYLLQIPNTNVIAIVLHTYRCHQKHYHATLQVEKIHENTQNTNIKTHKLTTIKKKTCKHTHTQKPERKLKPKPAGMHVPSRELLNDNMRRYRSRIAMSSHIRCCSSVGVGDMHVRSINCTSEDKTHPVK